MSKDYLSDYNPADVTWDVHKSATDTVSYFYHTSNRHKNYALRMDSCSELLRFMYVDNLDTSESKLKLSSAQFCRVRLCPVCQWRRAMAWRARLFQNLPTLLQEQSNLAFIFLTLTVKNCDISDLSQTLSQMNKAWNKLRIRKEFKNAVKGFIRATEVTKSDKQAHPHFHCIIAVNKSYFTSRYYIKTERWSELWQSCLKVDYLPVCDCRKIKQKGNQMEKAVLETLKYTTKIADLLSDKDWFLELSDQLFKKRFVATGGCFKEILKEEVSDADMLCLSETELTEEKLEEYRNSLFFGWNRVVKKYHKVKNPYE